jgi:hypothetical protein
MIIEEGQPEYLEQNLHAILRGARAFMRVVVLARDRMILTLG